MRLALAAIVLVMMLPGSAGLAQEEGGTPPIIVVPIPADTTTTTTTSTTVPVESPGTTFEPQSATSETQPTNELAPVPGTSEGPPLQFWLPWLAVLVVAVGVLGLIRSPRARGVLAGPVRSLRTSREPAPRAGGSPQRTRTYQTLAVTLDGPEDEPTGASVLASALYADGADAIQAAWVCRRQWIESDRANEVWWLVRSSDTHANILIVRPDGNVGLPVESSIALEGLLATVDRPA